MKFRIATISIAVVLLVVLLASMATAMPNEPTVTPVQKQLTVTLFTAANISGTTTTTAAPGVLDTNGREVAKTTGWSGADVFVTIDGTGTFTLTATVQVSADGTNWATADYEYATDSTIATQSIARTMTADGTEFMRVPLAGEYLRVQLAATGNITPTVKTTYRN
jgi:hypothetical protein